MPGTQITGVGHHLHDGFLSPDGRYLVVSSYDDHLNAVTDLAQARIVRKISAACKPHLGSGAVVRSNGRLVGIGINMGEEDCKSYEVTVFDMSTFEVLKRIPVIGPTESPAAHPNAPYIIVDIVDKGANANKIQFIDKKTLEVVRTLEVAGTLGHSHFREYTARGDFSMGARGGRLVIFDSHTLEEVKSIPMDVPAGVFSHSRARTMVGLQKEANSG